MRSPWPPTVRTQICAGTNEARAHPLKGDSGAQYPSSHRRPSGRQGPCDGSPRGIWGLVAGSPPSKARATASTTYGTLAARAPRRRGRRREARPSLAGHANPLITLRRSSHLLDARVTEAAERFDPARAPYAPWYDATYSTRAIRIVQPRGRSAAPESSSAPCKARRGRPLRTGHAHCRPVNTGTGRSAASSATTNRQTRQ